jgi:hypothetical protein
MSTSHDTNERRQAIWPWILMPIVVLLVAYMLHGFEDSAKTSAAQTQSRSPASTTTGDATDP